MKTDERVELHCHSKAGGNAAMYPGEIIKYLSDHSMEAVAITDTSSIISYPELASVWQTNNYRTRPIFGMEALVEDGNTTVSILVKNEQGRKNLYQLMSSTASDEAHPVFDLDEIYAHRKGLLLGSGAMTGVLYEAALANESDDSLKKIISKFDYIEVLPDAALRDITRRLIELSDQMGKMVVAVSDAHYMEPDDHIVWSILQHWNNNPVDSQMRHMYSTEEMLDAFDYLSEEKAYEIVVKNSRLIADMCETISFCLDGEKCKEDERYNDELREICKKSLCEKYAASDLVEAKKRLEIELEAVAEASQAFTLVQLKRLMEKTNLKSCDISLRGTAGGSMVMYLLGISELDPIKWNLSFEFIFGNQPNRGMDIEINLTESKKEELMKLLGSSDGQVTGICCGNTWTVSDSADTMIEKFEKDFECSIDDEKRNKIRLMLAGNYQKRSKTFGMFLVSEKEYMENFTPLTKSEDGSLMTYFDFHYLDSTFPKVNFIPMSTHELLEKLSEQTGVDLEKIPVQSEEMLEQLKTYSMMDSPEDEIPELSSAYVKAIMKKVQPENIEDFAKVVATLHGNNVWTDVQEKYVDEGLADIKNIIATREDIFDYLFAHGIERQKAYEIAEKVRKGIVAHGRFSKWSTYKKELSEAGIPVWYIRTCEEIKYLFPRAHVISCMYMSLRCLWFKVNYPELYKEIYEKGQLERNMG